MVSVRSGAAGPSTTHYSLNLTTLQASRVCRPACMLCAWPSPPRPPPPCPTWQAQLLRPTHPAQTGGPGSTYLLCNQYTWCLTCALPVAHPCVQHHGLEALLERNGKCEQLLDITTGGAGRGDGSWQQVHPSHRPCDASTALAFLQALRRAVLLHQAWGSHVACPLRPAARPLQASATCAPRYWTARTCRLWTCGRPASAPGAQPPAPMQPLTWCSSQHAFSVTASCCVTFRRASMLTLVCHALLCRVQAARRGGRGRVPLGRRRRAVGGRPICPAGTGGAARLRVRLAVQHAHCH